MIRDFRRPLERVADPAAGAPTESGRSTLSALFTYGAALTFARGIPVVAVFAASWVLGPDRFGQLAIFVTAVTTASLLADSGTDNASTFHASRADRADRAQRIGTLSILRASIAAVLTIGLVFSQWAFWSTEAIGYCLAAGAIAVFANAIGAINAARRVGLRIAGSGERVSLLIEKGIGGALFVAAVPVIGDNLTGLFLAYSLGALIGALAAFRPLAVGKPRFGDFASLVAISAPFIVSALCAAIVWRLPVSVLAWLGDASSAGYIALMAYPIQLLSSSATLGSSLLLVGGSGLAMTRYRHLLAGGAMGAISAAVIAGVLCAADAIMPGAVFAREALAPGVALALALPALLVNPMISAKLRADRGVWAPTWAHGCGAVFMVAAVVPIASWLAAFGAAIAIAASEYVVLVVLLMIIARREIRGQK